ncbi:putative E3 ubiquitin ligase SUD1 [Micractinium conductrix]|uniref:E3 ubiquitin ligase SUD1 n=1 Tax=Micractinium conductrix TaxID=554055 RepID=A0A2P6V7N7_9CHLO|nr:putative E3 ubiquitin ligase SUD1 [Micractinium conductrix]|eukprot:PSC70102.1 putative E3 ubiquitin ligase SUD1 [Micractinium conductrix]
MPSGLGPALPLAARVACDEPAATHDEESEEQCKYCLQPADAEEGGELMSPCACRTPVHQRCLLQWLLQSRRGNVVQCEICHTNWQGMLPVPLVGEHLAAQRQLGGSGVPADLDAIAAVAAVRELANQLLLHRERELRRDAEARAAAAEDRALAMEVLQNQANHLAGRVNTLERTNRQLKQEVEQQKAQQRKMRRLHMPVGAALSSAAGFAAGWLAQQRLGHQAAREGQPQRRNR